MNTLNTALFERASQFDIPKNRWDEAEAKGKSPEELLLFRSNLLGSDLTVTNFGGGNTSAKINSIDPLSLVEEEVLWVKGSGGDIGSMSLGGFATLYQSKLLEIEKHYDGPHHDDKMVSLLPHCTFNINSRAASIDTPLHSLLPFKHIDHVHPDAIIALAAAAGGESATKEIWGEQVGWLPWKRPGFTLGVMIRDYARKHPNARGAMLAGHGIICWGDTSKDCYDNTIELIGQAAKFLNNKLAGTPAFGGVLTLPAENRRAIAAQLALKLRGIMSCPAPKVSHYSDQHEILEFVGSKDFKRLAGLGTSCPDHFLRTKIAPLTLDLASISQDGYLQDEVTAYKAAYEAYYNRCATPKDPAIRDSNPVVVLVPGIGMITFASNKTTARIAAEFYQNAVNVMRGAEAVDKYIALDEQEAFNIEYWALEEAKLQRMPAPKPMQGKIALVTGGGGGIGLATAQRLLSEEACVMLVDRDKDALSAALKTCTRTFGDDRVRAVTCDVTDERQIADAFEACALEFGGCDILVANAGIASSAAVEDTTTMIWDKNFDVLAKGYFLTARSAFSMMRHGEGGSIIFVGSKNGVAAAKNASAYASAKASANHLARCLAAEGASFGIRVNVVNPDAVIRGSRIWTGDWREERASAHGVDSEGGIEEHYRKRSLLQRNVLPEDVAEAIYFFASELSEKSTGNMLNVDAGNAQAFPR